MDDCSVEKECGCLQYTLSPLLAAADGKHTLLPIVLSIVLDSAALSIARHCFPFLLSHVNYVPCSILCHHCSLPIVLSYLVSSRATFSTGATLSTLHMSKHLYALLAPQGTLEAKMRHVVSTFKYILYWLPPQTQLHNAKSNVM